MTNISPKIQGLVSDVFDNKITGNIIPHSWYHKITTTSGRPDRTAISILSEIVYWYRPRKNQSKLEGIAHSQNNISNNGVGGSSNYTNNKFQGDAWQTSYEHFEKKFGCSKETVRRTFVKLEELGLISREFRVIKSYGQVYNNILFIHLHKDKLFDLLPNSTIQLEEGKNFCTSHHKSHTPSPQIRGELYKEEEINLKTNKSRSAKSNFEFENKLLSAEAALPTPATNKFSNLVNTQTEISNKQVSLDFLNQNNKQCGNNTHISLIANIPTHGTLLFSENTFTFPNTQCKDTVISQTACHDTSSITYSVAVEEGAVKTAPPPTSFTTSKTLKDFHPLTPDLFLAIKSSSGRDFNKNFTDMLLSRIAEKYPYKIFHSNKSFINYMSKILKNELRNPINTNNESFNFALPTEAKLREDYLNKIESCQDTDKISQVKRKIIGKFGASEAHSILSNLVFDYNYKEQNESSSLYSKESLGQIQTPSLPSSHENTNQSTLLVKPNVQSKHSFALTRLQRAILTQITHEVFGENTEIFFVGIKETKQYLKTNISSNSTNTGAKLSEHIGQGDSDNFLTLKNNTSLPQAPIHSSKHLSNSLSDEETQSEENNDPILLKQLKLFLRKQYGTAIYSSWFSKLELCFEQSDSFGLKENKDQHNHQYPPTQPTNNKTQIPPSKISIKAPTKFARDWIKTNYGDKIEQIIKNLVVSIEEYKNYKIGREGVGWVC